MAEPASKRQRLQAESAIIDRLRADDSSLVTLHVQESGLHGGDFAHIMQALAGNSTVRSLNIKWLGIGIKGGHALAATLATNTTLTEIIAERNGFAIEGGIAIGHSLAKNGALESLDMSLNDIGPEGGRAFGVGVATNRTLTSLNMSRTGLGPAGGIALAEALMTNSVLSSLDLTWDDIGMEGGKAFGKTLAANRSLTELNMRWNCIGFGIAGGEAFAAGLAVNPTLTNLDMAMNELSEQGACAFGKALEANKALVTLVLERNEIGHAGAAAIAGALVVNTTLATLDLCQNVLGPAGGRSIAASLAANSTLTSLNISKNAIGSEGGVALGTALACNRTLVTCLAQRNGLGAAGGIAIASLALYAHPTLTTLDLSQNGLGADGPDCGHALAAALTTNTALIHLHLEDDDFGTEDGAALADAIAAHPALRTVDLSSNALTGLPIATQLMLARHDQLELDLCNNPLSSPPLGRRADAEELREYLTLLLSESTAVTRIRLMVLGFGGVGKTTFCSAATWPMDDLARFQGSLTPLAKWDTPMMAAWMRSDHMRNQHAWTEAAARVISDHGIKGADLSTYFDVQADGDKTASAKLTRLAGDSMSPAQLKRFARALASLLKKGYFSTVGAVKVEGCMPLAAGPGSTEGRACSLVDFAGQMEYLVSHQLLLASMHTLCMVIQPASSFGASGHRHHGSWAYWVRFLRALGDRRTSSLLLSVSQLDTIAHDKPEAARAEGALAAEFARLRAELGDGLGDAPTRLDYRPEEAFNTMTAVRQRLSEAAEAVARDWWVPASYERLAEKVRAIGRAKHAARELPILSRQALKEALKAETDDEGLQRMYGDAALLKRGVEYLEAVGDVMSDERLDCLLLDPVSWFAGFLAHFIRDDGNPPAEVERGVVTLELVVHALSHEYTSPGSQVPEVMSLVCGLELCIPNDKPSPDGVRPPEPAYLFPCLLPAATVDELASHWPAPDGLSSAKLELRGHRFRACGGFLPPGFFPGLLARLRHLPEGAVEASRMWKDCAVLVFGSARVLLRIDQPDATLDIVAAAPTAEALLVGASKGQNSIVVWLVHLIQMLLRRGYAQLTFNEAWLCSSAACHGLTKSKDDDGFGVYVGTLFDVEPAKRYRGEHICEHEGCWHFLGKAHALEPMRRKTDTIEARTCRTCGKHQTNALRVLPS